MPRVIPRLWTRCMIVILLAVVVIPVVGVHSVPVGKGMARSLAGHSPSRMDSYSSFDVEKPTGDWKLIVILVEFTDIKHERSRDAISEMVFARMNNFWREVSYGQLNVIGDTVGWIDIGHDEGYYGKDTDPKDPGSDQRDRALIADACKLAKEVDFSQYRDVMVVYAGHGQDSDPENTDLLWASAYSSGLDVSCGGETFHSGGSTPEVTEAGVLDFGALTHEFGHTIGLPDLYHATGSSHTDDYVGLWSLMASGSWGGPDNDASSPTGLESWSRIKLGWLSSVSVTLAPESVVQTLNPIGTGSGPRALKVATRSPVYYLVEAREKVGVDEYLPDSGVLITRIDEARRSGEGIVKVMDCHAETESIDDAACNLNESWDDTPNGIYVKVIGKRGTSYVVAVSSKPVSIIEVTVSMEPSIPPAIVKVDGLSYDNHQLPATFIWIVGSQHVLEVDAVIEDGSGIRHVFLQWGDGPTITARTVTASSSMTYVAEFKTQYLLTVKSSVGDPKGSGWHDAGSTAAFSVTSPVPVGGSMGMLGGKYIFEHWAGDSAAVNPTTSVTMDEAKFVTAEWRVDNMLPCLVILGIVGALVAIVAFVIVKHHKIPSSITRRQPPAAACPSTQPDSPVLVRSVGMQSLSASSRYCISCGRALLQESMFCEYCGAKQHEPP